MPRRRVPLSPFRYFKTSPEVIRLAVLLYGKYPLSLRNVEGLLAAIEEQWMVLFRCEIARAGGLANLVVGAVPHGR